MRWACRCCSVLVTPTNSIDAHGQVAWSRYPDAGIKSVAMLAHCADDGGQKARRTGENAKQPLKPLRGVSRLPSISGVGYMLVERQNAIDNLDPSRFIVGPRQLGSVLDGLPNRGVVVVPF